MDYEFQIARTEVTYAEWFEFVQAYGPYIEPAAANFSGFTGQAIVRIAPGVYHMSAGVANHPVEIAWDYAARYCNWLHNGKANTAEAFESGAYDTSTFEYVTGGFHHQQMRSPGARYWIPSRDEWVKAAHFDPDKNGPDQPGYWLYPHSSDEPPMTGPPGVGQTSTSGPSRPVASYITVQSPWGLWDTSGGAREWTETVFYFRASDQLPSGRYLMGTAFHNNSVFIPSRDHIEGGWVGLTLNPEGLRIARPVPAPAGIAVFVLGIVLTNNRRR